jgi:hypothetical protein
VRTRRRIGISALVLRTNAAASPSTAELETNDTVLWVESQRAVISGDTLGDFGRGLDAVVAVEVLMETELHDASR